MPRLTAISIENARPRARRYATADDGCRGLYLNVYPSGRKSWSVRYRFGGISRNLTLDGFPSLAQARIAATKAIADVEQGRIRRRRSRRPGAPIGCWVAIRSSTGRPCSSNATPRSTRG